MEVGVTVTAESPTALGERSVCSACFIFVALKDGKPVKVEPAVAANLEERCGASLAEERRKWMKKRLQLESEAAAAHPPSPRRPPPHPHSSGSSHRTGRAGRTSGLGALLPCLNGGALEVEGGDPSELVEIEMARRQCDRERQREDHSDGSSDEDDRRYPWKWQPPGPRERFDVLVIPGGFAPNTVDALGALGARKILAFVEDGGGFFGVCAGAYVGSTWGIELLPVSVRPSPALRRLVWPGCSGETCENQYFFLTCGLHARFVFVIRRVLVRSAVSRRRCDPFARTQ